jgi:hypothetical protein
MEEYNVTRFSKSVSVYDKNWLVIGDAKKAGKVKDNAQVLQLEAVLYFRLSDLVVIFISHRRRVARTTLQVVQQIFQEAVFRLYRYSSGISSVLISHRDCYYLPISSCLDRMPFPLCSHLSISTFATTLHTFYITCRNQLLPASLLFVLTQP